LYVCIHRYPYLAAEAAAALSIKTVSGHFHSVLPDAFQAMASNGIDTCIQDPKQECESCNPTEFDCAWQAKVICVACGGQEKQYELTQMLCTKARKGDFNVLWNATSAANITNITDSTELLQEHFYVECDVDETSEVLLFLVFVIGGGLASYYYLIIQQTGEYPKIKLPAVFGSGEIELPTFKKPRIV